MPGGVSMKFSNLHSDLLAKEAATAAADLDPSSSVTTFDDIKQAAHKTGVAKWQHQWDSSERGRHFYRLKSRVDKKSPLDYPDKTSGMKISELRLGYSRLKGYTHAIGVSESNKCSCGEVETVEHFLIECNNYVDAREQLRQELWKLTGSLDLTMESVLHTDKKMDHNGAPTLDIKICFDILAKFIAKTNSKSTDFDVHRNWLAITHSLPVRKWYFEDTSQWTLDYPPLFAWFEFVLSQAAVYFDPEMLKVENVDYTSKATVVFQRSTVIVTDLVYIYAVRQFYDKCLSSKRKGAEGQDLLHNPNLALAAVLLTNFGLIIIDHIHFQYNGFLYGLLLLSIVRIYEGRHMSAAFWFSALLNFKHLYLYVAPVYFVYLLRCYVFQSNEDGSIRWRSFSICRLIGLGLVVVTVFTVSFGPFVLLGQIPQVLSRLFPFKRGLCHAYWAPNFWALYNVADKAATIVASKLDMLPANSSQAASMTGGLVQNFDHTILPSISPLVTLVLSALSMLPCLLILWSRPKGPSSFLRALILCGFGSFMFGWHVHEKAILMMIIPLGLLVLEKKRDAQLYLVLSTVGHYSLFPLLFTQFETVIKICLLLLTAVYAFTSLSNIYRLPGSSLTLPLLSVPESVYLLGLLSLELYQRVLHHALGVHTRFPFLSLMITSVYCAIGVTYCWLRFYWTFYKDRPKYSKQS